LFCAETTDAIASFGAYQPGYFNGYNDKLPLILGEEKLTKVYREGVRKFPFGRWKEFFGEIPFIFGYFAGQF
jgi:hypothetical protein